MGTRRAFFRILVVIAVIITGVALIYLLKLKAPPTESPAETKIFLWEDGEEQFIAGKDSSLYNLLLQTLHRLNLQARCLFDEEKIQRIKENDKLVELSLSGPEDITINQWIKPEEREEIATDEDGYRILKDVTTALFILEDKLDEGLTANILVKTDGGACPSEALCEGGWGCWTIKQEKGEELDKTWIGEVNKILSGLLPRKPEEIKEPQSPELFLITKVIDGDTIEIETKQQVRYLGINTPEVKECFGKKALDKNRQLVEGKEVRMYKGMVEKDQKGRLLRYVWVEDVFVNYFLVSQGYATVISDPPDAKYQIHFYQAEEEAKENNRGLWKTCQPKPPLSPVKTTGKVVINPDCSQFNAPDNDNFNKEKEYVCLTNKDTVTINMKGWILESGWWGWTYTFPSFTLASGKSVKVHTGCSENTFTDLYWCKRGYEAWHNEGDAVYLRDRSQTIIDTHRYEEQKEPKS